MEALKPCPCCGSTKLTGGTHSTDPVYCKDCFLRGVDRERWNQRHPSPSAGDAEARLREALESQNEQQDETLPTSAARDQGLVWLEGWFDLKAALADLGGATIAYDPEELGKEIG